MWSGYCKVPDDLCGEFGIKACHDGGLSKKESRNERFTKGNAEKVGAERGRFLYAGQLLQGNRNHIPFNAV